MKRVLDLAEREARALGSPSVGSGQLLLGLLRRPDDQLAAVLEDAVVETRALRHATIRALADET